jgi:hypothetical protein
MMSKQEAIRKELEDQNAIAVTILLKSKTAYHESCITMLQSGRRIEKLVIDALQIIKQLHIESEFMLQSLSDYQRKKLDYEIVNNIQDGEEKPNDKKK